MARFVFIVPPLSGHVNPTLSVGSELIQRGHTVGWISLEESLGSRLPKGGTLLLAGTPEEDQAEYLTGISQRDVSGIESIKFLYEEVLIPLNRYMFPRIAGQLEAFRPDVVINDHQLFAGAMAAHRQRIPFATTVTAPAAIREDGGKASEWGVRKIADLQMELGLAADKPLVCSDSMALVFTSKAFFGPSSLPGHFHFVGPVLQYRPKMTSFDWERFHRMKDKPRILVSIGTTFDHAHKIDFFRKVITAFQNAPVNVLVVSEPHLLGDWPDNFLVQSKVPQLEVLPYLKAVVCHGGHNTVSEALTHGLPLVVLPIAYDQAHVAAQVSAAGAGIRLHFKRFKPEHLGAAVREVLADASYREAAGRIRASFEEAGGTARAAGLLENMVPL
ncbi:glycosyltransferase [Dinghuibacter silviterrae]|uniref:MGT family glycosyltransferase n=1 Tax=Dinghuibacter silviterrae TaxID=1539049 RepID=A0A4R8DPA6_9BACT|nr:nucleotide disphospho-sugar-binding domain-containing protein [Dinghuibacter silviterrae]TDW99254.1 MGT family glycosyltransferase [Dinghuibacter silviterrae]